MTFIQAAEGLEDMAQTLRGQHTQNIEVPRGGMTMAEFADKVRQLVGREYFTFGFDINCHVGDAPKGEWTAYVNVGSTKSFTARTLAQLYTAVVAQLSDRPTVADVEAALPAEAA